MNEPVIFDDSKFPDVYVTLISFNSKKDFSYITNKWMKLYDRDEKFTLFFDTKHLNNVSMTSVFNFPGFMKNTQHLIKRYLNKTVINIYDPKLLYLIKVVFSIQKPYAPVYVTLNPPSDDTNNVKLSGFSKFINEKLFKYDFKTYVFKP